MTSSPRERFQWKYSFFFSMDYCASPILANWYRGLTHLLSAIGTSYRDLLHSPINNRNSAVSKPFKHKRRCSYIAFFLPTRAYWKTKKKKYASDFKRIVPNNNTRGGQLIFADDQSLSSTTWSPKFWSDTIYRKSLVWFAFFQIFFSFWEKLRFKVGRMLN